MCISLYIIDITYDFRYNSVYIFVEKSDKHKCYPQIVNNLWTVVQSRGNLYPQPVTMCIRNEDNI